LQVYAYSEARQKLSRVLERAETTGKVLIRRKDGRTFALIPEQNIESPLNVPSIKASISTKELVALVRKERSRPRTEAEDAIKAARGMLPGSGLLKAYRKEKTLKEQKEAERRGKRG
jgi:antitoxin Phd